MPRAERPSVQPPGDRGEARHITVSFLPTSPCPCPAGAQAFVRRVMFLVASFPATVPGSFSCDTFCGEFA